MNLLGLFGLLAGFGTLVFGVIAIWNIIEGRKSPLQPVLYGLIGLLGIASIILFTIDIVTNLQNSILGKVGLGILRWLFPGLGF